MRTGEGRPNRSRVYLLFVALIAVYILLSVPVSLLAQSAAMNGGERGAQDGSLFFPQTVVHEFQVIHAGATAEIGDTNAGFVNVVTKEGSNKYHGEAFYIGRPAWTANDAFGHSLDNAQNEFGGSLGGPIKKNRAFFYMGAEQDYVNIPYWTEFEPQASGTVVPSYLSSLQQQIVGNSDPTSVFARADFLLNQTNTLNLQFNFNRVNANDVDLNGSTRSIAPIDNSASFTGDSYWMRGNLTSVLGPNNVNQFLAQWAQDQRTLLPNSTGPEFVINGFGILGGNTLANESYTSNINRYNDDLSVTHGGVILHFGADFGYNPATLQHEANLNGLFEFNSLANYLAGNPFRYQQTFIVGNGVYSGASFTAGYVHNSTWDLQQLLNQNLFLPTYDASGMPIFPVMRPNPTVGQLLVNTSSAHSSYDGMQLTANFQLPHRSQLSANYTLARARDNDSNSGPFSLISTLNPFNLAAEAGYSNYDVRNSFNLSAITNLPLGFKFNPILIARSGLPYTPIIGFDTQNDANDWNDRALLNGLVAPRNILRQPAFFDLDIRFVKDITLPGEGRHLDLFMDIFNLTNTANRNFGPEAISVFGTSTAPIYSAGQALFAPNTNQIGSARQVQFTVRITAF